MTNPINFGLMDPNAFARGMETTNRLLEAAGQRISGRKIAAGDREGGAQALNQFGLNQQADQVRQSGQVLQNNQMVNTKAQAGIDADANEEQLKFVYNAANTLNEVLKTDGPEGVVAAYDRMLPLFKTRGISDEQAAEIRASIAQDPAGVIGAIQKSIGEKLQILPSGSQAINSAGTVVVDNPAPPAYQNVGPNSQVMNRETGEIVAQGVDTTKPEETWTRLSPEESKAAGYRDNVIVRRSSTGKEEVIDEPPASQSSTTGGPKLTTTTEKRLDEMSEQLNQSREMNALMTEFMSINEKVDTGGIMAAPMAPEITSAFNNDVARMNSIANRLTPAMRQGLPGAASDRDVRMFANATLSVGKGREANRATLKAFQAANKRLQEYVEFKEAYALKNGNLAGSETLWNRYINDPANDLFMKSGNSIVPRANVKGWREALNWDEANPKEPSLPGVNEYVWSREGGLKPK